MAYENRRFAAQLIQEISLPALLEDVPFGFCKMRLNARFKLKTVACKDVADVIDRVLVTTNFHHGFVVAERSLPSPDVRRRMKVGEEQRCGSPCDPREFPGETGQIRKVTRGERADRKIDSSRTNRHRSAIALNQFSLNGALAARLRQHFRRGVDSDADTCTVPKQVTEPAAGSTSQIENNFLFQARQ